MIAMDLDSTLLDWNGDEAGISPLARGALEGIARLGIITVIATGRSARTAQLELEAQGWRWGQPVPNYLIAFEKYCYQVRDGKNVEEDGLRGWNEERLRESRTVVQGIILPRLNDWLAVLEAEGLRPKRWNLDAGAGWLSLDYDDDLSARRATDRLGQLTASLPQLRPNRNSRIAGLIPRGGTKGESLSFLSRYLGIDPESVIAIGDSVNDMDMLDGTFGFFPVAVANAEGEVKEAVLRVGGLVTKEPASRGLSEAIRCLILSCGER